MAEEVLEKVHVVLGAAGAENHVPVVQSGLEVEDALSLAFSYALPYAFF